MFDCNDNILYSPSSYNNLENVSTISTTMYCITKNVLICIIIFYNNHTFLHIYLYIRITSDICSTDRMDKTIKLGITLPKSLVQQIDRLRGDIPRSRYILRAIENYVSDIDRHAKEKKVTSTTKSKKEKI